MGNEQSPIAGPASGPVMSTLSATAPTFAPIVQTFPPHMHTPPQPHTQDIVSPTVHDEPPTQTSSPELPQENGENATKTPESNASIPIDVLSDPAIMAIGRVFTPTRRSSESSQTTNTDSSKKYENRTPRTLETNGSLPSSPTPAARPLATIQTIQHSDSSTENPHPNSEPLRQENGQPPNGGGRRASIFATFDLDPSIVSIRAASILPTRHNGCPVGSSTSGCEKMGEGELKSSEENNASNSATIATRQESTPSIKPEDPIPNEAEASPSKKLCLLS